jgi:SAM-dependent MidA family methyltransferase
VIAEEIRAEIAAQGGWITFARYMELALQRYYGRDDRQFGARGDFVTAPELGSLFGRTLARQLKEIEGPILELGAGSGALAETLLKELEREYLILETSAALRERQAARLGGKVRFLDRLPDKFRGVMLANEVVDAMPVHAVSWKGTGIFERGVALAHGKPAWEERPAKGALLDRARAIDVPLPYDSEIGLAGQAWMRSLAGRLDAGAILVIDYGFARREYYHPQRSMGTLMCHTRHRAHGDPFERPGEQDITAHVDFSALAHAAHESGLEVLGYATQAQFLVSCGITEVLAEANVENALHYAPLAAEAQMLLSPNEMGELFKVLAVGRGVKQPLLGFSRGDRSNTL